MSTRDLSQVIWRKSSRSGNGQDCVEVGVWRKSSLSGGSSGNCVEVAPADDLRVAIGGSVGETPLFLVRDSKDLDGPVLAFTSPGWEAFVGGVKGGEFDNLG